jgi:hypothetical protein
MDALGSASVVPLAWIEHATSPLPRECSTTELQGLALSDALSRFADDPAAGRTWSG